MNSRPLAKSSALTLAFESPVTRTHSSVSSASIARPYPVILLINSSWRRSVSVLKQNKYWTTRSIGDLVPWTCTSEESSRWDKWSVILACTKRGEGIFCRCRSKTAMAQPVRNLVTLSYGRGYLPQLPRASLVITSHICVDCEVRQSDLLSTCRNKRLCWKVCSCSPRPGH